MIIKNTTKLGSLLTEYPQLGMSISAVLPDFGSLEQPQLKETVLSITTIEHLANKTGREVSDLIDTLNSVIGLEAQADKEFKTIEYIPEDPDWIKQEPRQTVDGVELLSIGEHPLPVIQEYLQAMSPGEIILLKTNFPPQPMIDVMEKAGVDIYSLLDLSDSNLFLTFIRR
jgi:hypothetical protein